MAARGGTINQQVDDLQERMRLLQQDRRANVELLEANKATNAEEIKALRESNKEHRVRLSRLQKSRTTMQGSDQLASLRKEMVRVRSENDALKVESEKRKMHLKKLKDEAKACELESRRPSQEGTPLSRQIRVLENRLDKGMIKYNEAQSIQNTYEHIVKRLKDERVGFDHEITALDGTLQSKHRDYEELLRLSGDASHAREVAQQKLHKARVAYEEQRAHREAQVRERRQVMRVRKQMLERRARIEAKRKETMDKRLYGDDVEVDAERSGSSAPGPEEEDIETTEETEQKIDAYEAAFRKIKEATGVSDVDEVIEKIIGQEGTTDALIDLTRQNQTKIEELSTEREDIRKSVEDAKYDGPGIGQKRQMVDETKGKLANSMDRLERCKNRCDRLGTNLIGVKAGLKHLQNKLEIVREDLGRPKVTLTDATVVEVLRSAGDILKVVMEEIERAKHADFDTNIDLHEPPPSLQLGESGFSFDLLDSLSEEEILENRPYNQRITLPSTKEEDYTQSPIYEDGMADVDEDELSRERVKKASSQIVLAQERKKNRERRRRRQS